MAAMWPLYTENIIVFIDHYSAEYQINILLLPFVIDPILFKLAGYEDMHTILDEFEFRQGWTTDYGVSCT